MKVLAGLLALVVVATAVTTESYRQGKTYEYQYKAHSLSGIPLISNDRSGLGLWTKVQLYFETEERVVLQLTEPELRQVDLEQPEEVLNFHRVPELHEVAGSEKYIELPTDIKEIVKTHLSRPIRFTVSRRDGLVRDIMADREEPEWALNMKKAIVNKFQVQRVNQAEKKHEDTIVGEECEVSYDLVKDENNKRVITKLYSLDLCKTPSSFRDVIGIQGHRVEDQDDIIRSAFVSTSEVSEDNDRYFIHKVVSEGRTTLRPFSPEDGEMITYTRQELEFVEEVTKKIEVPSTLEKRSETLFSHIQDEDNQFSDVYTEILSETEKVETIKKLLTEAVEKIEQEQEKEIDLESTEQFMHAMKLMRTLQNKNSFVQLVQYFWQPRDINMRPMFVSCLSFCGSPALVEALPEIKSKLTTQEFNMIVTVLPSTHVPSKQTIDVLQTLYKTEQEESSSRQLLLTIGSQAHALCKPIEQGEFNSQSKCDENVRAKIEKFLKEEYKKATTETRKLIVLKAIGNSGLNCAEFLREQIEEQSLPIQLRVNAIYALRRVQETEPLRRTLLPVFRNEKNQYITELRIAAFNVLIEQIPTEEMLNTLVAPMNEEENKQVGNYIYSYLTNLIELPTLYQPTMQLTVAAQNLLSTVERFEDGLSYSKNFQYLITSISRRCAQFIEMNMIDVPEQSLPRTMNIKLAKYFSGYYMQFLEAGVRFEGIDNLFNVKDLIKVLAGDRFQREIVKIQSILNEDSIKDQPIEETRAYFFLKTLGNEIGVLSTEDYSLPQIKEHLLTWTTLENTIEYFNIQPIAQATIKVQSLMGMPVVADWSVISVLSLQSEIEDSTAPLSRSVAPRVLIKTLARTGVDMGLLKKSVGQCLHVKLSTPFTVEIKRENSQVSMEINLTTDLKNQTPEQLLEISALPVKFTEKMVVKDNTYQTEQEELTLIQKRPAFELNEEYYGIRVIAESHKMTDFNRQLPAFPFCGRHLLRLQWVNQPKPIGVKAELAYEYVQEKEYTYTARLTFNPKIDLLKTELNTVLSFKMEEENNRPMISFEVEPKWQSTLYRFFLTLELLNGEINPAFSWMEATEEKPIELTIRAQWGENKEYNPATEDLVVKSMVKKSDLQKMFEVEDQETEGSDCYKCEQAKESYRNIFCDRCIFKRSWLSQIHSKVFITKEKMYELEYLLPALTYYSYPYYSILESGKNSEQDIHAKLTTLERPMLTTCMTQLPVTSDDLITLEIVHDIHPYFTEQNITVLYGDKKIAFCEIPLIPAYRRMYNLPANRLTDVATDRFHLPNYGKCTVDELNQVRTLDTVVYDLPKEQNCQQVLIKDATKDREFEITTELVDNKRSLKVHIAEDKLIEIRQVESSYEVKINNQVQHWTNDEINTNEVRVVRVTVQTPNKVEDHKLSLFLKLEIMKFELYDQLVSVQMPFWYKNKLSGLCGDFNGETEKEFKLPNRQPAETLEQFVKAYSAENCRQ